MSRFLYYAILLVMSFCIILPSCNEPKDNKKNIRAYYYPIAALTTPLVYEYRAVNNDSLGAEYWYFNTLETDTGTYFTTSIYNQLLQVTQFSVEEAVSNGMLQKEYVLFIPDSTGRKTSVPAEIAHGNAFPFEVGDSSGVFLQEMKWTFSEEPLFFTTLIRNRRYIGEKKYQYKGEILDAITFSLRELIDDFNDGHLETETSGLEVYARNLGLVYFKKEIGKNLVLEYHLVDRYPLSELEKKLENE